MYYSIIFVRRGQNAANVFDASGKFLRRYALTQSVQHWIAIWCLPLGSAKSIDIIQRQTRTDMVHSNLVQMKIDGLVRVPAAFAKADRRAESVLKQQRATKCVSGESWRLFVGGARAPSLL